LNLSHLSIWGQQLLLRNHLEHIHKAILWLGKSPLFPHSQTFRFFAHGAFVLEPWTNAINAKNCLRQICIYGMLLKAWKKSAVSAFADFFLRRD
jgi:hypothetical protein